MHEMVHIPREFIHEILKKERDHRRFEEFLADLFSAGENRRYTTTAPSGDKTRDAYAQVIGGIALVCATTVQRSITSKIKADIDNLSESQLTILHFHYCSNLSLSEGVRDEMVAYGKKKLSRKASVQVHGLAQIVDRANSRQGVFEKTYCRELAVFESFYRRTVENDLKQERADMLRVVLACAFHPEIKYQRNEVVRNILLLALEGNKPRKVPEILVRVASELSLEHAPRDGFIAEGLQRLIDDSEASHEPNGYVLTELGSEAVKLQLGAAAADSLDGHALFIERLGSASKRLSRSTQSNIWAKIQHRLAEHFMIGGIRFIEDLRSLAELPASTSSHAEFQTFISDLKHEIRQMALNEAVTREICEAIQCFGNPSDEAFAWLSRTAVKYLVLCTLGLDPQVESQIHRKLASWTVCPDTHMLLSYLCEGDEGHPQAKSVMESLNELNVKILVVQAVLEEASHHATISHGNLQDLEQRYLQARRLNPTAKPFDFIEVGDNAYSKSFALLSGNSWKRSEWPIYIGQFYQQGTDYAAPLQRLLTKEINASHLADSEEIRAIGRVYAEQKLRNNEEADDAASQRVERDGRLIAALFSHGKTIPIGNSLILISDASSIRRFFESCLPNNRKGVRLSRPATLAYALMLAPGSHMNLETVQKFIISSGRHGLIDSNLPFLSDVMHGASSPFRRPSSLDDDADSQLLNGG